MSNQEAYLGRSLNQRAYDAADLASAAMQAVMRQNNAAGRLASGSTLLALRSESVRIFNEEFGKAAQFAFNLMESNGDEITKPLAYFAQRMIDLIVEQVRTYAMQTGIAEATVAPEITKTKTTLEERRERLLDDFCHGMMGDLRLKKDPVVSVINSQTNSPGGIQQVGVGNFSQTAFAQNHQPLIAAIDAALASAEFEGLEASQKQGFRDIADVVKEEAAKPQPNPGKLRRWSDHLVRMGTEIGMRVAVSDISQVLAKIFAS
ncbi:hypothetical protein [Bradyrhizobium erythrophlei]|uniref:Uncharacterized protein n=1 Tax=Bradyrhizobium erythrophlei TaxID=1437360 RepID=A0A1M5MQ30_9BRAD|nr:hypothetical protein [Bradyrhizobium erythrophlei]SHG79504.1 hypothetical protein SAMN05443248_2681 [Bradyrhizobium erythrophlei]